MFFDRRKLKHKGENKMVNKNNIKGMQDNIRVFKEYPDLVNFQQLKEMLSIGKNSAYELLMTGKIKHIKIGRNYRIYKKDVVKFINSSMKAVNNG